MHCKRANNPLRKGSFQYIQNGFTLIETIIGMVVLAVSLSVLTAFIYPIAEQSAAQLHQIKAAELAQSMLNEIQNKAFDQHSDMAGGRVRCGDDNGVTCSTVMGPETGEVRATFNDVDDYNGLAYTNGEIRNSQGQRLNGYTGYSLNIKVCNDSVYNGTCNGNNATAKLIVITVITPTDFSVVFSTYRVNF